MTGIVLLAVALLAAAAFAVHRARVDGRFRSAGRRVPAARDERPVYRDPPAWTAIAEALPSEGLGDRATLVQFSSAFCAPCRTTRVVLSDVAGAEDGVRHLEVDAEQHLDLVRTLDVRRTPTTLVLDAHGHEVVRAAGAPHRDQVLAALASCTTSDRSSWTSSSPRGTSGRIETPR